MQKHIIVMGTNTNEYGANIQADEVLKKLIERLNTQDVSRIRNLSGVGFAVHAYTPVGAQEPIHLTFKFIKNTITVYHNPKQISAHINADPAAFLTLSKLEPWQQEIIDQKFGIPKYQLADFENADDLLETLSNATPDFSAEEKDVLALLGDSDDEQDQVVQATPPSFKASIKSTFFKLKNALPTHKPSTNPEISSTRGMSMAHLSDSE